VLKGEGGANACDQGLLFLDQEDQCVTRHKADFTGAVEEHQDAAGIGAPVAEHNIESELEAPVAEESGREQQSGQRHQRFQVNQLQIQREH
jgi:hypothetical protein